MSIKGIVRKIDSLGRIVIPIEIRNILNINDNDSLEININDNNIILTKYSYLENYQDKLNKIIEILPGIEGTILISNKDKVINKSIYENMMLSDKLIHVIDENKFYKSNCLEELCIGNTNIYCYYEAMPISINYDTIGLIIFISNNKISKDNELYINCLKNLIENIYYVI